ncbi:MAG: hypothetical protein HRT88_15895 [Lentisphaeraceae bacterium]|nr:hypothetical protein [Lentisphaeraceae bacterium]
MSEEIEKLLSQQVLKKPSEELDRSILAMLETVEESAPVMNFPWQKILTYVAAAMLFLSMGIHRYVTSSPSNDFHEIAQPLSYTPILQNKGRAHEPTLNVSTTNSLGSDVKGEVITLADGRLVQQVIRKTTILKTYYDKKTKVHIRVEEPHYQLFYVPVDVH